VIDTEILKKHYYLKMQSADLPRELVVETLRNLSVEDLARVCQTNVQISQACQDPALWQALVLRDFPGVRVFGVADPRALYMDTREQQRAQARAWIDGRKARVLQTSPKTYWRAVQGQATLQLKGAPRYVDAKYPNSEGYDRFVYWPDYRVAGSVSDIVRVFRERYYDNVNVGELNQLTQGQFGSPAGTHPLTEDLVYQNSFDPLNPAHRTIIEAMPL